MQRYQKLPPHEFFKLKSLVSLLLRMLNFLAAAKVVSSRNDANLPELDLQVMVRNDSLLCLSSHHGQTYDTFQSHSIVSLEVCV
jgi:uncharacterized UPF0160 family protein